VQEATEHFLDFPSLVDQSVRNTPFQQSQVVRQQALVFELHHGAQCDPEEAGQLSITATATALGDVCWCRYRRPPELGRESVWFLSWERAVVR
jgi:hypothetical protein